MHFRSLSPGMDDNKGESDYGFAVEQGPAESRASILEKSC